jgi:23S rRNA (uracil1939-C5)-methyltransferase
MGLQKGHTVELTIDRMAYGGQGIGRVDDFVVFVRGAVPGDRMTVRISRKKRRYAEGDIIELCTPSPHRVSAPCPYSGFCGGCQWQQVSYERQLTYKTELVKESIEHIGGMKDVKVLSAVPSENIFAYRNKMEFSFSDRRWFLPHDLDKRGSEGGFALGLHVPGTYHKVIDLEACMLQNDVGNQILREVKKYVSDSGIPVYGLRSHEGFWRFLTIRYSRAFNEWMVNVVTSDERPAVVRALAETVSRRVERIETCVNNINARKASIAVGEREIVLTGNGHIEDRIGSFTFQISANSFFQTNTPAAEALYRKVAEYAELENTETALDLYCGTGTIPIFLASSAREIIGIEISKSSVLDAQRNCEKNGIHNCHFICGDIRKKLSAVSFTPHVLIIDPPRTGMHKDVLSQVLALSPERIIYVSCNPATLARDVGQMTQDYELVEIQPVDMFPHTYHIEAIAKLRAKK